LQGHNGKIISVTWSNDDKYLVSAGVEGAIYQWDVANGTRYNEVIQKGTEYRELALSNDAQNIIAVTNTGYLREMVNSNIVSH
jgi:cilia- and flagella-associated protein 57